MILFMAIFSFFTIPLLGEIFPIKKSAADPLKYIELKQNAVILDVGCLNGELTAEIAEKIPNGQVIGIDIFPKLIIYAKNKFQKDNLQFIYKHPEELDFENQFDLIFSFFSLHLIKNHESFLQGAYRGLKSSGILAISIPMGLPQPLLQAVTEVISAPEWSPFFQNFQTGWNFIDDIEYAELLAHLPWVITRLAVVPQKEVFRCKKHVAKFLSEWFPYLNPIPIKLKQKFLLEVIDRYLEIEPCPGKEVHFNIRRLEVVASKE